MKPERTRAQRRFISSWRQLFFWPAALFVLVYVTQSLWMPLLVPLAMHRAHSPQATLSERRREWEFVRRRAAETKNQQLLQTVAMDTTAPGEVRGTAWASLARQSEQTGDNAKAGDCYLSALDSLISDPELTGAGAKLQYEVWDQIRFHLGTVIDPRRYREVLVSWVERTDAKDQGLLEQLVFELGKMKLLANAEPRRGGVEGKP